jgi:hypothetical protein
MQVEACLVAHFPAVAGSAVTTQYFGNNVQ